MSTAVPDRFCDVVMKGGITSGVVYPFAITALAEKFRFKSIGGTSAGAIAAALAAAAEARRSSGGFSELAKLPAFLGADAADKKGSNLFRFFQPQPATRRLFRIAVASLGGGWLALLRVCVALLWQYWWATLLGCVPAAAFASLSWHHCHGYFCALCLLLAVLLLIAGVGIVVSWRVFHDVTHGLTGNMYGLCTGLTPEFSDVRDEHAVKNKGKPLTYWLTETLNGFFERKPWENPLTFGELWEPETYRPGRPEAVPFADREVNLEMMTTCLTHGRPYRLPFRNDEDVRENNQFWFKEEDFRRLFPASVVNWMIQHGRQPGPGPLSKQIHEQRKREGFHPLPPPGDLPVVVGVRMSLSFPVLLSAVPLYAADRSEDHDNHALERCWFSDGGVCSNFPVHFFDSPLPRWPTLSLDLEAKPEGTPPEILDQPGMVKDNADGIREKWNRFEYSQKHVTGAAKPQQVEKSGAKKLLGLVGAFVTTMQNWSDQTQARLPGYRDRIARVGLTPKEGGLNLNMPEPRITALSKRGKLAADALIGRFAESPAPDVKMTWENHRWIRLRSFLASLESMVSRVDRACSLPQVRDLDYSAWLADPSSHPPPSYKWTNTPQRQSATSALEQARSLAQQLATATSLATDSPRPRPDLRPRAQI